MKKFVEEFKEFALQGNVFDMAIGVVIGGAFTAIVNSLVSDIITPFISLLTNTENLEKLEVVLRGAVYENGEEVKEALVFRYGAFLDSVISFLLIALVIFFVIKAINKLMRIEEPEEVEEEPEASEEAILLTQILDELKKD
ncbi:MAG TPA: large conductance mechanosensitive channel protein MscL [Erysipelothrix sp.]|nr:large conductance mechanosensitive channel protein MscL [Erysipelothrix sp.]